MAWSNIQKQSLELPHNGKGQKGKAIKEMTACLLGRPILLPGPLSRVNQHIRGLGGGARLGKDVEMEMSPYRTQKGPSGDQ